MTPEQIKLMITMAKTLEQQGNAILALQNKRETIIAPQAVIPMHTQQIQQIIEKTDVQKRIKMEVNFHGAETIKYEDRVRNAEAFLVDMEKLFIRYNVRQLIGSYEYNF